MWVETEGKINCFQGSTSDNTSNIFILRVVLMLILHQGEKETPYLLLGKIR